MNHMPLPDLSFSNRDSVQKLLMERLFEAQEWDLLSY